MKESLPHRRGSFPVLFKAVLCLGILSLFAVGCGDDEEGSTEPWTGDPVVRTSWGSVRGFEDEADTWAWKAIPFAKPPVGPLRWKAPRDPDPWQEVLQAREFCQPCAQYALIGTRVNGTEDCLYLNVWRPRTAETNLPVYFWIHGGGNSIGTVVTEDYHGANLASRSNLVVVTVHYRLGPLGWFTHPALRVGVPGSEQDDSGNYGTLDLIKALTWVQRNIRAFGGDPDRVMIAGVANGAVNALSLLISPLAEGLFHRALVESGAPATSSIQAGETDARRAISRLLVNDGTAIDLAQAGEHLEGMTNSEVEDYLRSQNYREMLWAYEPWFAGMIDFPYLFRDGSVIPASGHKALEDGTYMNKVPVILGSNKEEIKLFIFADPYFWGRAELFQIVAKYGSDSWKAMGVDQVARKLKAHTDLPSVYAYHFLWGADGDIGQSQLPPPFDFMLGSCHGLEIPFFFGNEALIAGLHHLLFTEENRPGREVLTDAMMGYAAQFARTGNPNAPGSGLPEWQPWSNDENGPKSILLDVDQIQNLAIRMSTVEFTEQGVRDRIASEVREPLQSQAIDYLEEWLTNFSSPE